MRIFQKVGWLRILFLLTASLFPLTSLSAPVVPIPGESGSFLYFPADIEADLNARRTDTVGRISIFSRAMLPDGWLECNGASILKSEHPELVEYLAGAAATSAVLPDLRGVFLRGHDGGRGVDPGRVLGSTQLSQNLSHTHTGTTSTTGNHNHPGSTSSSGGSHNHFNMYGLSGPGSGTVSGNRSSGRWASHPGPGTTMSTEPDHIHTLTISLSGAHTHAIDISPTGGLEARPRNVSVIFAIRAGK